MNDDNERLAMDDGRDERARGLERLPRRRGPERDLWPGIEARLAPRGARRARVPLALAASLVAGLALVAMLSLRDTGPGPAPDSVAAAATPLPLTDDSRAIVKANLSLVRHAERELQQALKQDPDSEALRSLLASAEHRQRALSARL